MKKVYICINKCFNFLKNYLKPEIRYESIHLHDVLENKSFSVDKITDSDLLLDEFIQEYDQTITSCGSEIFYHWLHSIKSKDEIVTIQQDMKNLQENEKIFLRNSLSKYVGKQKNGNFIRDLWNGFSIKNWVINKFYILYLINILVCIGLSVIFFKFLPFFVILFFVNNSILFLATNFHISHITSSLGYFLNLCYALSKINKKSRLSLSLETPDYKKFSHLLPQIIFFKEGVGGPSSGDIVSVILDYLRIFFALELFAYKTTERFIKKNIDDVKSIYLYVGYLDCILNSCRIMDENRCCFPEITDKCTIDFKNMTHPLLKDSVSQSRSVEKNLIVTGLNMSGKTTFMKSLGLNQILATSFGFCFAENFSTASLYVISSICINDELLNGKSRYYAEAERLVYMKEIVEKTQCLCLVDEILSGTNSEERIYGSTLILKEFAKNNTILIAATHDTQIAENLSGLYDPVYFDGEISGDKIEFDYLIKEGIVSKKNGLLLLKLLGLEQI